MTADPAASDPHLALAPLGAGDLIDRAVRLYRRNFWTFIMIAAPPVVTGAVFSVVWTLLSRLLFSPLPSSGSPEIAFYYLFIWAGGVAIWLIETVATLIIMGGASRNFVRHLLFGEPITFSGTYRNAGSRFGSLLVASTGISIFLGIIAIIFFYLALTVTGVIVLLVVAVFSSVPFIATVISIVLGLASLFGSTWLFFLVASRFAYVPQVILVEGQGVLSAIGRSTTLAGRNSLRLMALFVFTIVATYSALAIFYIPLTWYAWAYGVELMGGAEAVPAAYEIAYSLIWQISVILLSPVWMIGLCLLYVDERVRAEGYDIELLAARRLGDIPSVPRTYSNPLQPALGGPAAVDARKTGQSTSVLGLD